MRTLAFFSLASLLMLAVAPTASAEPQNTFGTLQSRDLVAVSSPEISPDGKRAVVLAAHVNWKDDKTERDLDIFDLATHARRTLTYKREGLSDPAWSPDGTKLAFIANEGTGDDAKPQVFVMPLDGGDARPVTSDEGGVEEFAWRPDGNAIAYAADEPKPKRTGVEKYLDAFVFTTEPITTREPDLPVHVFVVDVAGGKAHQLTTGPASVASGEAASRLSWSADGKEIAFVLAPNAILNDATQGHIDLVDASSGKLTRLTLNNGYEGSPLFSPDGKRIAYQRSNGDNQVNLNDLYVTTPAGGNGTDISAVFDRQVHDAIWASDSRAIYYTCADHTSLDLVRAPLEGKPKAVDVGDLNVTFVSSTTAANGSLAFVGTTPGAPGELYILPAKGKAQRISDYNAATRALTLATAATIAYPTSMGITGDGVLLYPPGYVSGRKYPLVLLVHGGPTSSSATTFDTFGQALASRGWLVLEPNYRGSDNLGIAYQRGVLYDPEDGRAAISWRPCERSRPWASSTRIASPFPAGPTAAS